MSFLLASEIQPCREREDAARQQLGAVSDPHVARGLISFACEIGSDITADGIETRGELDVLRDLGVQKAQGYFLSRPGSMADALTALRTGCPALTSGASD